MVLVSNEIKWIVLIILLLSVCCYRFRSPSWKVFRRREYSTVLQHSIDVLDASSLCVDYNRALRWQKLLQEHHISLQSTDTSQPHGEKKLAGSLLLLQHSSVYTLGSGSNDIGGPFWKVHPDGSELSYETVQVDRAGKATYHGPGQLVLYPILDLHHFERDINIYLRGLEEVIIRCAARYGLHAYRINRDGYTGVWIDDRKVAAIGLKIRRWVTMHGVSVNVSPDLRYFDNIIPCGITDKCVGSFAQLIPHITVDDIARDAVEEFMNVFDFDVASFHTDEDAVKRIEALLI